MSDTKLSVAAPDAVHRRRSTSLINLGSNELLHRNLRDMHSRAIVAPLSLASYPTHDAALDATASVLGLPPGEVLFTAGSDAAIRALHYSLVVRGRLERTVVPVPNYPAWEESSRFFGAPFTGVPMESGHSNVVNQLRMEVAPRTLVALSWPNGPIGSVEDLSEIEALASWCRSIGSLLIVDACYAAFHGDVGAMLERVRRAGGMVIMSGSKMFGLAGARIAVVHGDPELIGLVTASGAENAVSQLALNAWKGCLDLADEFETVWADVKVRRRAVTEELRSAGFAVPESYGNFLHIVLPEEGARQSVARAAAHGYRVKINSLPGNGRSMRFTVGDHPDFDLFIDGLPTILAGVR